MEAWIWIFIILLIIIVIIVIAWVIYYQLHSNNVPDNGGGNNPPISDVFQISYQNLQQQIGILNNDISRANSYFNTIEKSTGCFRFLSDTGILTAYGTFLNNYNIFVTEGQKSASSILADKSSSLNSAIYNTIVAFDNVIKLVRKDENALIFACNRKSALDFVEIMSSVIYKDLDAANAIVAVMVRESSQPS